MKVTKTVDKPSFSPVTLNLTFETQEEYEMFKEMIGYDISIPNMVYRSNTTKQIKLQSLMQKVNEVIYDQPH